MRECSKWLAPTRTPSFMDGAFAGVKHEMENPISHKYDRLGPLAFQQGSFCLEKPIVWIPDDRLGISDDEISRISQQCSNVRVSNEHASLDEKGRVTIMQSSSGLPRVELMKL